MNRREYIKRDIESIRNMKSDYSFFTYKLPKQRFIKDNFKFEQVYCKNKNNFYDFEDDYVDLKLYSNEFEKVKIDVDKIIYKLYHKKYTLLEKENMISLLIRNIKNYINIWNNNTNSKSSCDVNIYFKILLAFNCDEEIISIVNQFHSDVFENNDKFKNCDYVNSKCLDFSELYIAAGDRALFENDDFRLAKRFYELALLDWRNNKYKKNPILEDAKEKCFNFENINTKYNKIMNALESHQNYNNISQLVDDFFNTIKSEFNNVEDVIIARRILLLVGFIKEKTMNHMLYKLSEEDEIIYIHLVDDVIYNISKLKDGPSLLIADYVKVRMQNKKNKDSIKFMLEIFMLAKAKYIIEQLRFNLLLKTTRNDIAYYTSLDNLFYMCPCNAEEETFIGKLALMNVSYMNDPNEGKILQKFLYGNRKYKGKEESKNANIPYVFLKCFTTQTDYLPMWEMYGNHAEGCCIVFDTNEMLKRNFKQCIPLYQICYLTKQNDGYNLEKDKNENLSHYDKVKDNLDILKNVLSQKNTSKIFNNILCKILGDIVYLFKDSSYSYEHEIRMILTYDSVSSDFKYTSGKFPLLFVYPKFKIFIKEIILGPKFSDACLKIPYLQEQIEKMCMILSIDSPKIKYSNIDYK